MQIRNGSICICHSQCRFPPSTVVRFTHNNETQFRPPSLSFGRGHLSLVGWMDGCERTTHSHSSTSSPRDIPIEFNRFDCQQKRRNGPRSYFQLIWLAPFVPPSVLLTIQGFRIIIMQRLIGTRRHMVSRKSFANHSPPVLTLSPDTPFLTRRPLEHADSPHVQSLQGSMACSS